jgi:hypothetical protein
MVRSWRFPPSIGNVVILSVAIVFVLSGYGGVAKAAALHPTKSASGPAASGASTLTGAGLRPQPNGPANLTWDPTTLNTLTVTLSPTGLAPATPGAYHSAPYPASLNVGSCQQPGNVMQELDAVTADQYGAGASTTIIKGVAGGIPAKGWDIALNFPAAAHQKGGVLACANIINPLPSTSAKQTVKAWLHAMPAAEGGKAAYGKARLSLSGTTLTVNLLLGGLVPGSKHDSHIHAGSCEKQGPAVHDLETVTADAKGRAQVEMTIKGVETIPGNWYIPVHNGTDLTTQAGFEPIACGNVFTRA